MKKIFTFLAAITLSANSFGQVITQSSSQTVSPTGSVACGSQANGYTADNSYIRVFKLSDYGITNNYKITNVSFGVQTVNSSFPVEVNVYNWTGTFPTGTATLLGTANVNLTTASAGTVVNTGTNLTTTVNAGSTFVVEIFHDGDVTPAQSFYMGTNPGAQTGPSYLSSETCGITTPTATGTGALAAFSTARWVMSVTGVNATLGTTEVLNSRQLQIYPNPVKDVLNFKLSDGLRVESVEIYDLAGKQINVKNSKFVSSINVSNLVKGNYILRVKADDGKVHIQKIIKD
jgi:hypothetical protein